MKTDKFTSEEMQNIAQVLGWEYKANIIFPDGTKI